MPNTDPEIFVRIDQHALLGAARAIFKEEFIGKYRIIGIARLDTDSGIFPNQQHVLQCRLKSVAELENPMEVSHAYIALEESEATILLDGLAALPSTPA